MKSNPEGQEGTAMAQSAAEAKRAFIEAKQHLEQKGDPQGVIEKFDRFLQFSKMDQSTVTDEQREEHGKLSSELKEASENDPDVKDYIVAGTAHMLMEEEDILPKQEEGELTPEEVEKAEEMQNEVRGLINEVNEATDENRAESLKKLERRLGDIGDADLMKKIRSARGIGQKVAYNLCYTFFIAVALYMLLAEGIAKPFEGKK